MDFGKICCGEVTNLLQTCLCCLGFCCGLVTDLLAIQRESRQLVMYLLIGNWSSGLLARLCLYFRLRYDKNGLIHSCGFASVEDTTSSDLELWMPRTTDTAMAADTAKYIIGHVGSGFCEMIEQEKSAMSWMNPRGLLVSLLYQSLQEQLPLR